MTIFGFDVDSYNKAGFAFQTAKNQGYRVALVKFGGMNLAGNAPYMMNGYHAFAQAALDVGFDFVGDYLVTGGSNPAAAAQFWLRNRHGGLSFHELDNEKLDDGNPWNDGQACVYFDTIGTAADRWMYGSRDSLWNAGSWPGLASRKIKAHVAIYNGSPFQNVVPRTYPADLVLAHQYTSSASIGGLGAVDANAFADNAFITKLTPGRGDDMEVISSTSDGRVYAVTPGRIRYLPTPAALNGALALAYNSLDTTNVRFLADTTFMEALASYGLGEFTQAQMKALTAANGILTASWLGGSVQISDAQLPALAQLIATATPKPPTKGTITLEA